MFQTNNDADDLGDYTPHINDYINEGYDRIVVVWDNQHVPSDDYPLLEDADDQPNLPLWLHRYIADWATWLVYRNGNPQKQNRGAAYRASFLELLSKLADTGGKNGYDEETGEIKKYRNFINIPV
ncbi:MAG: hypothetical protein J6Y20_10190 [Lachnospiraceae bacterium]|nr:hypothetical protein [Lachnospiraceae bacterium]MBP5462483.1 hypothetical protein [Lachnospiraceae bacterium]